MTYLTFIGFFLCAVSISDSTKCFECKNVPYPYDCLKLTACDSDEVCFTEQVVLSSRNVAFNSGCLPKSRCPPADSTSLNGKRRSANMLGRNSTDITTCIECCEDDFCNMKGCGVKEITTDQRGPYCYGCEVADPTDCTIVTVCGKNELCMLHNRGDSVSHPVYRGSCESQAVCENVSHAFSSWTCDTVCCSTDFCNDRCVISLNITTTPYPNSTTGKSVTSLTRTTTQHSVGITVTTEAQKDTTTEVGAINNTTPQHSVGITVRTEPQKDTTTADVTTSTRETTMGPESTSTLPPRPCKTDGGYLHLHNSEADLCVQIVKIHAYWNEARTKCTNQGNDLVVLDTHAKALLLRTFLSGHDDFNRQAYWIGANNFQKANQFSWVNHAPINSSEADWEPGEPDNNSEECVCMYRDSHADRNYQWHDQLCKTYTCNYICQRL